MRNNYEFTVLEMIEAAARNVKTSPLNLGGISGVGGGAGGPPGGFIGQLPQTRVAYDETEAATLDTPASGMSLVDNLNHIRYRVGILESGSVPGTITVIDDNDLETFSDVTVIHFSGGADVVPLGGGEVQVIVTASGGGGGDETYLRLDATNDPVTGQLDIVPTGNGEGGIYIETNGDAYSLDVEQLTVNDHLSSPTAFLYRASTGSANLVNSMLVLRQDNAGSGSIIGGFASFKEGAVEKFKVDKDGHAYDNGELLIVEAPIDGQPYLRQDGDWVIASGITASGGGHVIEDEGTPLTNRAALNFVGNGVTVTDDNVNDETDVTIPDIKEQVDAADTTLPATADLGFFLDASDGYTLKKSVLDDYPFAELVHTHANTSVEEIQDIVGAMFTGNTEAGVVVTYEDSDGTIDVTLSQFTTPTWAEQGSDPGLMAAGEWMLYFKSDGMYTADDAITITGPMAAVNGWHKVVETWTRTGNHTFTVSGDLTARYRKGTKIRYKDGGSYEYGVVASSSHAAGTTTITLITNSDYAMAAATITDRYISYIESPEGFPTYFNFTPSWTNVTVGNGTQAGMFYTQGTLIRGRVSLIWAAAAPTSAITGIITVALPVAAAAGHIAYDTFGAAALVDWATALYMGECVYNGGTLEVRCINAAGTYAVWQATSGTIPFTFGASDRFTMEFTYVF